MWIHPFNNLTVQFQHQSQHPMRRWMLRPEVYGEVAQVGFGHSACSIPPPQGEGGEARSAEPGGAGVFATPPGLTSFGHPPLSGEGCMQRVLIATSPFHHRATRSPSLPTARGN